MLSRTTVNILSLVFLRTGIFGIFVCLFFFEDLKVQEISYIAGREEDVR